MNKTIKIGSQKFELPFRYEVDNGENPVGGYPVDANGLIICDLDVIGRSYEEDAEIGEAIAEALNLWAQEKNRYEVVK